MSLEAVFCLLFNARALSASSERVPLTAEVPGSVRPNKSLELSSILGILSFLFFVAQIGCFLLPCLLSD